MGPPRNKLITGRTSLPKRACPPSLHSGQVRKAKEDKLTKVLVSQELEIKKGPRRAPFDFWLPGQDSLHFIQGKLTLVFLAHLL
jgi:hypothetical protein